MKSLLFKKLFFICAFILSTIAYGHAYAPTITFMMGDEVRHMNPSFNQVVIGYEGEFSTVKAAVSQLQGGSFTIESIAPELGIALIDYAPEEGASDLGYQALFNSIEDQLPTVRFFVPQLLAPSEKDYFFTFTNEVLIRVNEGDEEYVTGLLNDNFELKNIKPLAYSENEFIATVAERDILKVLEKVNHLNSHDNVQYCFFNFLTNTFQPSTNDPHFPSQWNLHNTGAPVGVPGEDINIQCAWDQIANHLGGFGGLTNVQVAVIDQGIDANPDLSNALQAYNSGAVLGYNSVTGVFGPGAGAPTSPGNQHGTQVASVIAAETGNGIGIAGVGNPESQTFGAAASIIDLQPINCFTNTGAVTAASMSQAINFAINTGARIIVMSLNCPTGFCWFQNPVVDQAVNNTIANGVMLFNSSGNFGGCQMRYPAGLPAAIAVGGSDACGEKWNQPWINHPAPLSCSGATPLTYISCNADPVLISVGSSFGPGLDFVAPAVQVPVLSGLSTHPILGTGTSFAAPQAAGIAALLMAMDPNNSWDNYMEAIGVNCDKVGGYNYGLPNPMPHHNLSGWSEEMGYGRVDACDAVHYYIARHLRKASEEVTSSSVANVYPSLMDDRLVVEVGEEKVLFQICGIDGKIVFEKNIPANTKSVFTTVNTFAPGLYFAMIQTDTGKAISMRLLKK